jgi:hypothetical protein
MAGPGPKPRVTVTVWVEGAPSSWRVCEARSGSRRRQCERQTLPWLARAWLPEGIELVEITDFARHLHGRAEMVAKGCDDPQPP